MISHEQMTEEQNKLRKLVDGISYLTFKGGGIAGQTYVGAIKEMMNCGLRLSRIRGASGASAGSIMAMLLGLGYTYEEIEKELFGIDWKEWLDHKAGVIRDAINFNKNKGWCQTDVAPRQIKEWIKRKLGDENATFLDLMKARGFQLVVCVCNVSRHNSAEYHGLDKWTLDFPIWKSVLASMAIPVVFEPPEIDGDEFGDGGWIDNYPAVWPALGVESKRWLGFWVSGEDEGEVLETKREIGRFEVGGLSFFVMDSPRRDSRPPSKNGFDFVLRVGSGATAAEGVNHKNDPEEVARTVYIQTQFGMLDFDVTEQDQQDMIEDGRLGVQRFLIREGIAPSLLSE